MPLRLALLLLCCCRTVLAEPEPLAVAELRPGVYVHTGLVADWGPASGGDVANLGFVVGNRCVAVIDTGGTPDIGRRLRAAVARVTPLPVCFVINTHAHPDHVLGNSAFSGEERPPEFIAHARLAAALAARGPYYLHALQRDFGLATTLVTPTRTVADTLALDLGGRTLQLKAWRTAHTDCDLTVYDPATKTLFLSDLLFVGHLPVLDGKLLGWLAVLGELAAQDVSLAVPGHGAPGSDWPAMLAPQARYLNALLAGTRQAIRAGLTIEQAVERVGVTAAAGWPLAEQFHRRNVTAAYAELEWEE